MILHRSICTQCAVSRSVHRNTCTQNAAHTKSCCQQHVLPLQKHQTRTQPDLELRATTFLTSEQYWKPPSTSSFYLDKTHSRQLCSGRDLAQLAMALVLQTSKRAQDESVPTLVPNLSYTDHSNNLGDYILSMAQMLSTYKHTNIAFYFLFF